MLRIGNIKDIREKGGCLYKGIRARRAFA